MNKTERSELRWVIAWAIVIVLLASLPYLWGMFITPPGYSFTGLTHNIDDGAVYLSWMRQAADGHFFIRNLFTNEPQPTRQFNLLFLVMGWFAAILHLPLILVFHLFRIVLGFALILGIWQFSKLFLDDVRQRKLLVPLVGLSAGIGWWISGAKAPTGSVDVWQPEAITFLSIYLNPLFLAGLLLMLGSFYWLELARREGSVRYAIFAGVHLLVLGNVHTYDVLTVACIWASYIIVLCVAEKRFPTKIIGLSAIAAVIAAPSVAYQFYVYSIDPIYRARANSPIPSPSILSYLEGYGLVLAGAVIAVLMLLFNRKSVIKNRKFALLVVWSIVGFVVPYIPIAQQRKLVMGLHIPQCILCAYALSVLLSRLSGALSRIVFVGLIILMAGSNVRFISNDMKLLNNGRTVTHYSPYISTSELAAMRYFCEHKKPSDTILAPPLFSLFAPAMTGHQVYYGHWSETQEYADKFSNWVSFIDPSVPFVDKLNTLSESGATYYVSTTQETLPPKLSPLKAVFSNGSVTIFRVIDSVQRKAP